MLRTCVATLLLAMILAATSANGAGKDAEPFTQKEFARAIIAGFGWGDGLPKEPGDRDYLVILGGKRSFRYEVENAYTPATDNVSMRDSAMFGPFTGRGWLMGIAGTTEATCTVLLPIGGDYAFKAIVKGDGFVWKIGGRELRGGSASGSFREVDLGRITVKPGVLQITVTFPPNGAVDSFAFTAPDHLPIQPFGGWRFREPLTAQRMAETGIAMMNLYGRLPVDQRDAPRIVTAVDTALPTRNVTETSTPYLGTFTSRAWLRANHLGAAIQVPVKTGEAGFYLLRAAVMGERIAGDVNGSPFAVAGKPYLDMTELGLFQLESGDNMLTLNLPPMGGLDRIELTRKSMAPADVMGLAGVTGLPERQVTAGEANAFITTVRGKYPARQ